MITAFPYTVCGIIFGLLLSDASLEITTTSINARFSLEMSIHQSAYLVDVFFALSHYCKSYPTLCKHVVRGEVHYSLRFRTRSLPIFTVLHCMFYVNGLKIVPLEIFEFLTPVALAHWIAGDGIVRHKGLGLCTHSFTIPDTVRLINVLIIRYAFECTLRMEQGKFPMIYIKASSIGLLRSIVLPHLHSAYHYKLYGLKVNSIKL
jgi:hypothetical protein